MILAMAGFDYTTSSLEEREQLALTKTEIKEMLSSISGRPDVESCVYVSTCGRGELYLFCGDSVDAAALLAESLAAGKPERAFRKRTGRDAADHLFHTACGMRSQIYGEDQILAQLKQSLEMAREAQTVSGVLDRLFLSAIAAGKKVKTSVHLTAVPVSVADRMLELLKSQTQIGAKDCLVIGNGEIGRLCAAKLLEAGAKVTVTVRNYRTREVLIPVGCKIVDYRERFRAIPAADVIVSATTSPHYTLPYPADMVSPGEKLPEGNAPGKKDSDSRNPLLDGRRRWLFDLALPRDIAPEYGKVPGIHLFGLDEVSAGESGRQTAAAERAEEILKTEEEAFFRWLDFRRANRQAVHVGELAAEDVTGRVHKRVKKALEGEKNPGTEPGKNSPFCAGCAGAAESDGETVPVGTGETARQIEMIYADAVRKVVDNLMYDLRNRIPEEQYRAVIEAMEQSVLARSLCAESEKKRISTDSSAKKPEARSASEISELRSVRPAVATQEDLEPRTAFETEKVPDVLSDAEFQVHPHEGAELAFFPLFLDTREKTVLMYGAGQVALRRVKKLMDFACRICVISPDAETELLSLAERYPQRIRLERQCFEAEDLIRRLKESGSNTDGGEDGREDEWQKGEPWKRARDILFVVAATNHREVNREIGEICRARDMPVSVADRKEESTCFFPGIATGSMGEDGAQMVAGISSEGADHRRTAWAVRKVAEVLVSSPDRGMQGGKHAGEGKENN